LDVRACAHFLRAAQKHAHLAGAYLVKQGAFLGIGIGIAGHGDDIKRVGRLALKSIVYFEIVTTLALFIGLFAVNLVRPGEGVVLGGSAAAGQELAHKTQTGAGFLEHLVPRFVVQFAWPDPLHAERRFAPSFGPFATLIGNSQANSRASNARDRLRAKLQRDAHLDRQKIKPGRFDLHISCFVL